MAAVDEDDFIAGIRSAIGNELADRYEQASRAFTVAVEKHRALSVHATTSRPQDEVDRARGVLDEIKREILQVLKNLAQYDARPLTDRTKDEPKG